MPLDPVSVEVVQDTQAGLLLNISIQYLLNRIMYLMRRVLPCGPVVWLGQARPAGVAPVGRLGEGDRGRPVVAPEHRLLSVVNNPTCSAILLY